ncbi:hypothetical protein LTSESEN_5042, partial [Salmonella enterica subsp. enterica serovar Senftenberg str. A4-543]
ISALIYLSLVVNLRLILNICTIFTSSCALFSL